MSAREPCLIPAEALATSAWPAVAGDLRRALTQAGHRGGEIDAFLEALRPVVAAVERAGTRIDSEIAWALVAVAADRQRRHARHARIAQRHAGAGHSVTPAALAAAGSDR